MIGVVLWSKPPRETAIIWCEDNAALAYLQGRENLASGGDWPETGDLVELECETSGTLRYARRVEVVSGYRRSDLPEILRGMSHDIPVQPMLRVITNDALCAEDPRPQKIAIAG